MRVVAIVSVVVGLALAASPALAQPPGGTPPGLAKKPAKPGAPKPGNNPTETPGGGSAGDVAGRLRSLGLWLDDASVLAPGESWLTFSMQRWSAPVGDGFDAPVFDVVAGVARRVQAFASVPYTRTTYTGLPTTGELGTTYLGAKMALREADAGVGVAVIPTIEILSASASTNTGYSRVNAVLPLSAEWRHASTRVYGTTGYFTRGAYFVGGALEQTLNDRVIVTAALNQGWSTRARAVDQTYGLRSSRTDASGNVTWVASPHLMLFAGLARTVSSLDLDSTRYAMSAGASINLSHPGRRTPLRKP
jgi:hypothetical protein